MNKHTPGPWSVFEDCNKVAAHQAKFPSTGMMGAYWTESITDSQGEFYNPADARLVAAAPELLEALKLVVQWRKVIAKAEIPAKSAILKDFDDACVAITKATGGKE